MALILNMQDSLYAAETVVIKQLLIDNHVTFKDDR